MLVTFVMILWLLFYCPGLFCLTRQYWDGCYGPLITHVTRDILDIGIYKERHYWTAFSSLSGR